MNLTQIIERAEKEYGERFGKDQDGPVVFSGNYEQLKQAGFFRHPDYEQIKSFLSEKIKEAYEAGYDQCAINEGN